MNEFEARRQKLFDLVEDGTMIIVHAGTSKISSEDEYFPFVVNNNFFYLTGIKQENSVLMMVKSLGDRKCYLFIDEYDPVKEKWTGKRITNQEASVISGINNVLSTNMFESRVDLALQKGSNHFGKIEKVYVDESIELKVGEDLLAKDYSANLESLYSHIQVENVRSKLIQLRLVKSTYEIDALKRAINLTQHGINQMLMNLHPGIKEYQLANIFDFYGLNKDKTPLAFTTIVAAGKNATCLHYPSQLDVVKDNEMVLFDLGYSVDGYSADISRTYPVNGKFNELQRKVYGTVLLCNKAVIAYARPGLTLNDLQEYASNFMKGELVRIGLMKEEDDIRKYYYHSVSHHLGLDTHDISDNNRNRNEPLKPGNVITVEPGLYMAEYEIGVRIEDDILITENGAEVLSRDIPKEIDEIEKTLSFLRRK